MPKNWQFCINIYILLKLDINNFYETPYFEEFGDLHFT